MFTIVKHPIHCLKLLSDIKATISIVAMLKPISSKLFVCNKAKLFFMIKHGVETMAKPARNLETAQGINF